MVVLGQDVIPVPAQWGLVGLMLTVFTGIVTLVIKMVKFNQATNQASIDAFLVPCRQEIVRLQQQLRVEQRNRQVCDYRLSLVLDEMRAKGIMISHKVWTEPELVIPQVKEQEDGNPPASTN